MKITIAAPRYPPATGGAEQYIERVGEGLARAGHSVRALTTDYEHHWRFLRLPPDVPRRENRAGVDVARDRSIPWRRYGYFFTPATPARVLFDPPDLVYALGSGYWPYLASKIAGRIVRAKVIIQPNFAAIESPFYKAYRRYLRPILHSADAAVFYSEFEKALMQKDGPIPTRSIIASPGVGDAFFKDTPTRGVLDRFGLGGKQVVLSVGRIDEAKRLDVLIKAAPKVLRAVPDAAFLLAGPDFGEVEKLKSLAAETGVADRIVFPGALSDADLVSAYHESAALAHPSGFELFGIVLVEAFASGLPVVAANTCSIPEIVAHERNGLLVAPRDEGSLADALIRILTDHPLRTALIKAARQDAMEKYNWDRTIRRIEELCREVAG